MSEVPNPQVNSSGELPKNETTLVDKLNNKKIGINEALGVPLFASDDVWKAAYLKAQKDVHPDTSGVDPVKSKDALTRVREAVKVHNKQVTFGEEVIEARANVLRTVDVVANNPEFIESDVARRIAELRKSGASKAEIKAALEQIRDVYSSIIGVNALKKQGVTEDLGMIHTNSKGEKRKMLVLEEAVKAKDNLMKILNNELNRAPKPPEIKKPVEENPYNDIAQDIKRHKEYQDMYNQVSGSGLSGELRKRSRETGSTSLSEILGVRKKK